MYFKKLELAGFKSFCEKTAIQFESGVTAIVGPNGCGKSNIADAIRWVLGEQSAKSLRGSSMEDVIFNGSAAQEPLNFAEVSLTLSNESKIFPVDYEEVTIARRLYRSGESEYLLNKNAVRLRDIHELLMGTGIGTESYSIIEQGKMDIILNSKPEDRRVIFEEAAGITKFKSKKKEALRKLEQTDANLLRVNDIIQEVKRQIASVERQAKKAESYKIEFEKLKKLELAVASREFLTFDHERRTKEENLAALKEEEARYLSVVEELENRFRNEKSSFDALDEALKALDSQEMQSSAEIRKNQDRVLLNRERMGELLERRENLLKQAEGAGKRLTELAAEEKSLAGQFMEAEKEEAEGSVFLGSIESEFTRIEGEMRNIEQEETPKKERLSALAAEKMRLQGETAKIEAEFHAIGHRRRKIHQEEDALLREIREIDEKFAAPLFESQEGADRPMGARLESRIQEFKERLLSIFREWFQRPQAPIGPEEESHLGSEIQSFSDEILRIQGALVSREHLLRHSDETKRKLEEKLLRLSQEAQSLESEEAKALEAKQRMPESLEILLAEEKSAADFLLRLSGALKEKAAERESLLVRLTEIRSRQSHFTARREKIEKDRNWILDSKRGEEERLLSLQSEAEAAAAKKTALESENAMLEETLSRLVSERDGVLKRAEGVRLDRARAAKSVAALEEERREKSEFLLSAREKVHAFQMESAQIGFEMDRLKERIFNAYQVDLAIQDSMVQSGLAAESELAETAFNLAEAKAEIQKQKEKLSRMGPVNLVAIDEHEEMKQRFEFLTQQEQDLVKAKEDLHKAILKINRTTKELFTETFSKIQKYFTEYYRLLFGGGSAELLLLDENDVLESGIEIVARPPGKKLQNISLLSGGEKALTAVALLFALFKVKPSPFCVLDEIDAPLDESNVERFCGVLKEFVAGSQFIVITHNKRTMNLADAMYGITMAATGVSSIVSVRFSENQSRNGLGKKEEALAL